VSIKRPCFQKNGGETGYSKGKKQKVHLITNQGMNSNCAIRCRYISSQDINFCLNVLTPAIKKGELTKVWAGMFAHIPDIIRFSTGRTDSKVYETLCTMYHATGHKAKQSV